ATGAPGKAQPFTAQQSAGSKRRVDQIALPSPPLPSTWTLTLKDLDARTDQEASQPGPIAPRALDREHGRPELARPREQAPITRRRRRDLAAVELSAERVQPDGDVHLLVRVDTDRHRPLHDLTSGSSRWSTGLGQGCVGQKTHASIRSPASRAKRRRETGRIQGKRPPATLRGIPPPLRTLRSPSDTDRPAPTLPSVLDATSIGDRPPARPRMNGKSCHPCHAVSYQVSQHKAPPAARGLPHPYKGGKRPVRYSRRHTAHPQTARLELDLPSHAEFRAQHWLQRRSGFSSVLRANAVARLRQPGRNSFLDADALAEWLIIEGWAELGADGRLRPTERVHELGWTRVLAEVADG